MLSPVLIVTILMKIVEWIVGKYRTHELENVVEKSLEAQLEGIRVARAARERALHDARGVPDNESLPDDSFRRD